MWRELFGGVGFADVEVQRLGLMIPADDPRSRMTAPLPGLPIGDQITAMETPAYEAWSPT